jgi:phosphoglycolate phosphatase
MFDIDGTLIRRAGPHHRQALIDAIRKITGFETSTDHIPVHGMLDSDILSRMLEDAGAPAKLIRSSMAAIMQQAERLYVRRCPDLRRKTCPGVRGLLYRLKRRGAGMALVTGNLPRIGWKKMERAGLDHYFDFGAFAGMARTRAALVRLAIRRARSERRIDPSAPIVLIGDAPSDVLAAKANRIRSVAVHTGISTRDELLVHEPDLLLEDLRKLRVGMLL